MPRASQVGYLHKYPPWLCNITRVDFIPMSRELLAVTRRIECHGPPVLHLSFPLVQSTVPGPVI
jgi:hypothetical protein